MRIRPSTPSRSTNAPLSTMLEMSPSTIWPGCRRSRICWRTSLRSSSRTARRESTTSSRGAVELDDLALDLGGHELVEVLHPADVHQRGGQEAAYPEIDDQAALDHLDAVPSTGSPDSAAASMRRHAFSKRARFLESSSRPSWSSLVRPARHFLAQLDLVGGVDGLPDTQLVGEDYSLALVADVHQDLVLVDPDDLAGDYIPLFEGDERGVVVGDNLAVDLQQEAVGALYGLGGRGKGGGLGHEPWTIHTCCWSAQIAAEGVGIVYPVLPRLSVTMPSFSSQCRTRLALSRGTPASLATST